MPLLESKWPRRAFLVNKAGCVTRFDSFSLPLTREALSQLVYNHWIRTFAPTGPVRLVEEDVGSEPAARPLPAEIKLRVMMPVRLAQAARFNGVARLTGATPAVVTAKNRAMASCQGIRHSLRRRSWALFACRID